MVVEQNATKSRERDVHVLFQRIVDPSRLILAEDSKVFYFI